MASALGWKLQKAAGGSGGIVAAHFSADGWRPVQVAFRSMPKAQLAQGEVSAIRVAGAAGGQTFQLTVLRDPEFAKWLTENQGIALPPVFTPEGFAEIQRRDVEGWGQIVRRSGASVD